MKIGCTGCGYCMPCPKGVDIPEIFRCYNNYYAEGKRVAIKEYMQCTLFRKNHSNASNCVECGLCEKHCPQHIEIRKELKNAANKLESPVFKFVKWAIKTFKMWG